MAPPPGVELDGLELHSLIASQLTEGLQAARRHRARAAGSGGQCGGDEHGDDGGEIAIDFTNRDAPTVCTHYDWAAPGDAAAQSMESSEMVVPAPVPPRPPS